MRNHNEFRAAIAAAPARAHEGARSNASVAAIVVLYHPNSALLARLVESISAQVDKIFVIDNTPGKVKERPIALDGCTLPVVYQADGVNKGLARAQNIGIERALRQGYSHVLLLDQDSALPPGAVDGLLAAEESLLRGGRQVAAVGPMFIDDKTGERGRGVHHRGFRVRWFSIPQAEKSPVETDYLIASGSLIRASVLRTVGLMRDELFIDWVDTEWQYRAGSFGFTPFLVPTVVMRHCVGDATGKFMGKRFNLHSPARNYYIVRNALYLLRERHMNPSWRLTMLIYVPKYILAHSWMSPDRWKSMQQMLRGAWEGLTGTMRPFTQ
jgi:rhamnosyltransferase